ncbi:PREDICTED: insecticyanin-A-like [Papilio xuthus]|uniref:Insecticyanin-A-like n=2 Tax=Papilio xuthus TaxID=66420 RepID=A0AAJ6ZE21_PAPXU|nr:PREDICTED: insecticyanin-A-like [Papilio xuthus]
MFYCLGIMLTFPFVSSAVLNGTCPFVTPRELDLKELDGKWYVAAVVSDMKIQGDCAMILFNHKSDNTTDVSISWISNNTISYYNGSVELTVDSNTTGDLLMVTYTDQSTETFSFLDVEYEHYAVLFACYNNEDGTSSTYELWKLTRTPHIKDDDALKLDRAVANYSLQDSPFIHFNNTENTCKVSGGTFLNPSSLIMTSAAAITLFRRLY